MAIATVDSLAIGSLAAVGILQPIQAAGPSTFPTVSGLLGGLAAFGLVLALGGLLIWRFESFVDRSMSASMDRPLSSLAYGMAAHGVIAFAGVYLTGRFARIEVLGGNIAAVGLLVGGVFVLLVASLGFTVVGATIVALGGERRLDFGLVVGALLAGLAGFLGFAAGAVIWFIVVSMGIGGPARQWIHADATDDLQR